MPEHGHPRLDEAAIGLIQMTAGRGSFPNLIYVVYDPASGDAVVVDPGFETGRLAGLLASRALTLRGIVVTHSHRDHTDAAPALSELADVPVWASQDCLASIAMPEHRRRVIDADCDLLIGTIMVRALMTPGHTACSVSFLIGECFFPGDTIFMEGCGLATSPGGDAARLFETCTRLKRLIPGGARVYPGHQYERPVGASFAQVCATNFYLRLGNEGSFVAFCNRARGNREPPAVGTVPEMTATIRDLIKPRHAKADQEKPNSRKATRSCQALPSSNHPVTAELFRSPPTPA